MPEFERSWQEACARKPMAPEGALQRLFDYFQTTTEFTKNIEERTRSDYKKIIEKILEPKFGDFPIKALSDQRTRGVFKEWRDELALKSLRRADYAWTVLARILSVAADRGRITVNPCAKGGRLYEGSRVDKIWTAEDEAIFLSGAPAHLHLPLLLGLWTGQRQSDLLRLSWSAYDGKYIRLRQRKTGARVTVPVGKPLKAALDAMAKRSTIILTNLDGQPWKQFGSYFGKVTRRLGITGLTFHDLRGSAVTGSRSPAQANPRSRRLRAIRWPMCARFSIGTTCTATLPWERARSASLRPRMRTKQAESFQTGVQTGLRGPTARKGKAE
jgi:integrase